MRRTRSRTRSIIRGDRPNFSVNHAVLQSSTQPRPQQSTTRQKNTGQQQRRRGSRLMKGNSSSIVQGLSAAAELVDNAVFCGGNLHFRVDAQQLSEFARKLVVNVVSCYKIKPRSQRNEIGPVADRAAFRLCIDFADCEKTAQ